MRSVPQLTNLLDEDVGGTVDAVNLDVALLVHWE